ncbi:MAG: hypothetical protein JXB48_05365 [Candidatus Latescibacteria bacterium]|nr:hypothetical protein [Candidatus Latescibacterota bacterium]
MHKKEFIGVTFKCCNVYSRIYLNKDKTAFEGICPKCYKKRITVKVVQSGGDTSRFFEAD